MIQKQLCIVLVLLAVAASSSQSLAQAKRSANASTKAPAAPSADKSAKLPAETPQPSTTVAYWRFEGDGKTTPEPGTYMTDTADRTGVFSARGSLATDSSGNGNILYTWNANFTGHRYVDRVPADTIPQTGEPNTRSIRNSGIFPSTFTWSRESKPTGVDLETIIPLAWTIEASINRSRSIDFSTFVCREGQGVATGAIFANGKQITDIEAPSWAPLYFQTRPVEGNAHLTIQFTDMAGITHRLVDPEPMEVNTWYQVAAVSDGATLSLYKDSGAGYVLVNSTSLAATLSADTRLCYDAAGTTTPDDEQWGWSVGRGRKGFTRRPVDDHVERWMGSIDEVRISSEALPPSKFLFAPK